MLLLISAALAAPSAFFAEVGPDLTLSVGGGWPRAAKAETGWHFFWSAGGDYNLLPMSDDLEVVDRDRIRLTGRSDLVDNQIVPCPDGTWLHVASGQTAQPNDSAWAFRYDADFALLAEGTVVSQGTARTNDMAPICSTLGDFVGFNAQGGGGVVIFEVDEAGAGTQVLQANGWPMLAGASFVWDGDLGAIRVVGVTGAREGRMLLLDDALGIVEEVELPLGVDDAQAYWPQATVRVGNHWIVAHMLRREADNFNADEGNVWLAVFDLDWNLVEHVAVSSYTPPSGCMRPGLARSGDRLLVLWDKENTPHVTEVTLNLATFGEDPDWEDPTPHDTGDDGGADDTDGGKGGGGGCGCTSAAPAEGALPAALGLFGVLATLGARRRGR